MAVNLTDRFLKSIREGDKLVYDGATTGLCVAPSGSGKGKWLFRYTSPVSKKRREAGLGTYPLTSLAEARDIAVNMARLIRDGKDPIDQRNAEREATEAATNAVGALTFEKAAREV